VRLAGVSPAYEFLKDAGDDYSSRARPARNSGEDARGERNVRSPGNAAAGDLVPADLRLLQTRNLHVQEAVLTGESVPVEKWSEPVPAEAPLGDRRGDSLEEARTIADTLMVLEIFYLFNTRYLHGSAATMQGLIGTPAVLIGVGVVVVLQLAFTYLLLMQTLFETRPVGLLDGIVIIAAGVSLLVILEIERAVRSWLGFEYRSRHAPAAQPA
jgi:magnesium-transporting ATPase (P-type)